MQWELVRGQIANLGEQISALARRLVELSVTIVTTKKDQENSNDRLRLEMLSIMEHSKDSAKQLVHPLVERLDSMSHLIQSERSARDMIKTGLEQQVLDVRDALEAERSIRRKEAQATTSLVQDYRQAISDEVSARMILEEKHSQHIGKLGDRIEAESSTNGENLQDLSDRIKYVSITNNSELQDYVRQVHQTRSAAESVQIDVGLLRQRLEERMVSLESYFSDMKMKKLMPNYECIEDTQRLTGSMKEQLVQATQLPVTHMQQGPRPVQTQPVQNVPPAQAPIIQNLSPQMQCMPVRNLSPQMHSAPSDPQRAPQRSSQPCVPGTQTGPQLAAVMQPMPLQPNTANAINTR